MHATLALALALTATEPAGTATSTDDPAPETSTLSAPPAEEAQPAWGVALGALTGSTLWALSSLMEAENLDAGTWKIGTFIFKGVGIASTAFSLVGPFLSDIDEPENPTRTIYSRTYLLDYRKQSALTGALNREPEGTGIGWDMGFENFSADNGFLYGGAVTYQQTGVASNEWATAWSLFAKLDAFVGWNGAPLLRDATHGFLKDLSVRAGPSYFRNWTTLEDNGSRFNVPLNEQIGTSATIVNALGYELSASTAVDFWGLVTASARYQRGQYPQVVFPSVDPEEAALLVLVGFDDLRNGEDYTWEQFNAEISIPLTKGILNAGGSIASYESSTGTSVNNRSITIGTTVRF